MLKETESIRPGLDLALVGMAGRFPGAKTIDEFWDNLRNGVESISFMPDEELHESGVAHEMLNGPNYIKAKAILEDIEYFDAFFFDYKPGEAEKMDPQMRIFHECTWHALEDAAYDPETYSGLIGLYAGAGNNLFWENLTFFLGSEEASEVFVATQLSDKDHMSTRIAYKLNLTGPSFTLETQCSTSLVAFHLACQGLLSGECDMAVAGGISITLPQKNGYIYQEGLIISPDGHCRAFAANAQGTVFGDGVGVVVLKRIEEAIADKDHIYAVVKGSAINNDGKRKVGYSAPSVEGQAEVIRAAFQLSQVEPESIGYLETHGTGTSLGDPIEIQALTLAFNTDKKNFCRIGSIKANMGHLDNASGIAGLIKTVLVLNHKLIPPSLHFEIPNPEIEFKNTPFRVNAKLTKWENNGRPLRAGVSSFGVGGTNVHVILEEAPAIENASENSRPWKALMISSRTKSALDRATENLLEYLKKTPGTNLADAAYTLQVGRREFEHRRMLVCSTVNEAAAALERWDSEKVRTFCIKKSEKKSDKPVVFMFPGQGAQYVNMGLEIYKTEPIFHEEMDRCFDILKSIMGYSLKNILYPSPAASVAKNQPEPEINQTEITQPLLFIFEYALAKLLMNWGIKPWAMIGHSIGEYVAACLSGVFSLEDALKSVVLRGKLMQQMPPGSMLSVPLSEEELEPLLNNECQLALAAVNTSSLCAVSGPHEAIGELEKNLQEKGCDTRRLQTSHAFHSSMMDPILKEFEDKLKEITLDKPKIPYISNVNGKWITGKETTDCRYWARHIRESVRFYDGMKELLKAGESIFVEVGPGRVLSTFVRKNADKQPGHLVVNLVRHPQENLSDLAFLLDKIGEMWLYGKRIDWSGFYMNEKRSRIPLPAYSFESQRYWKLMDTYLKKKDKLYDVSLLKKKKNISDWFYIPSWKYSILPPDRRGESLERLIWLVFMDECGIGVKLVERLERESHEVITLKTGPAFSRVSDGQYTVDPGQDNCLEALFNELNRLKKIPDKILHLWGITKEEEMECTFEGIERAQELGYYTLLSLAQAVGGQAFTDKRKFQLVVITNNMQEVAGDTRVIPGKAAVLGPVKVIGKEYPGVSCRSVDINLPEPGTREEERLVTQLLKEAGAESSDTVIAYRSNHRLKQNFDRVPLDEVGGTAQRIKEEGVYLVTGGLGGIGFAFAEYLARSVRAKLILTGRSSFPFREEWEKWLQSHDEEDVVSVKIRKLLELEKLGAGVLVCSVDVSDSRQMEEVIAAAEKQLGRIDGVLHAAGVADYAGVIQRRTREMSVDVIAPKIKGTLILDRIFKGRELDFFILCSSIGSIIASYGQVAYCAANAFMDAFANYKNCISSAFTLSINWDSWQEVGMAAEAARKLWGDQYREESESMLQHGILPEEGIEAFNRILGNCSSISRIAVFTRNLTTMIEQADSLDAEESSLIKGSKDGTAIENLQQRPDMSVEYIAPRDEIEQTISDIWRDFLGLEKVGIHDNFFDLGATSLDIVQVNEKLKKELKQDIPVVTMFEFPTVGSLAKKLSAKESGDNLLGVKKDRFGEIQDGKKLLNQRLQKRLGEREKNR